MANSLHLEEMSMHEKLQTMELLWDELCKKTTDIPAPTWHGDVLAERDAANQRGEEQPEDWQDAKRRIRAKIG